MSFWKRLLMPAGLLMRVAFLFVLWQAWVFIRPRPREYTEVERRAVEVACRQTADALERALQVPASTAGTNALPTPATAAAGPVRIGVAHLANDPTDVFTSTLRLALAGRKAWQLDESSVIQKLLADLARTVAQATSLDEVMHAGRRVELDVILMGKVVAVGERAGGAQADVDIYAYDARVGQWLMKEPVRATWRPTLAQRVRDTLRGTNRLTRLAVWLLFAGLLPWVTAPATRRVLERKSNRASFILLTVYTGLDLLLAFALAGFRVVGPRNGLVLAVLLLLCAGYNFWACERIAERERA